jgi:hypothetical protein
VAQAIAPQPLCEQFGVEARIVEQYQAQADVVVYGLVFLPCPSGRLGGSVMHVRSPARLSISGSSYCQIYLLQDTAENVTVAHGFSLSAMPFNGFIVSWRTYWKTLSARFTKTIAHFHFLQTLLWEKLISLSSFVLHRHGERSDYRCFRACDDEHMLSH